MLGRFGNKLVQLSAVLCLALPTSGCDSRQARSPASDPGAADNRKKDRAEQSTDATDRATNPTEKSAADVNSATGKSPPTGSTESPQDSESADDQPKLPQPTAEQLARWQQTVYDPLRLLEDRKDRSTGFVSMIEPAGDGKHFLTAGARLMIWSLDPREAPTELLKATSDENMIQSLAVSPRDDWCAVLQRDGWLRIFSLQQRTEMAAKQLDAKYPVHIAIATDGSEIAVASRDRQVTILNPAGLDATSTFEVGAGEVSRLEYIAPKVLVVAGETTASWDTTSGKLNKTFPAEPSQSVVVRSPDQSSWVLLGNEQLQHLSVSDDRLLGTIDDQFGRDEFMRFSSDGKQLATLNNTAIRIWDIATGQLKQVMDHSGSSPTGLCWIPGTRLMVAASITGGLRIWGSAEAATSHGMTPLQPNATPTPSQAREPATAQACLQAIDLRLLPKFPGSKLNSDSHYVINGTLPTTADEAKLYYRHVVGQLGWIEFTDPTAADTLMFEKNGFELLLSVHPSSATETFVNLQHAGNMQFEWIPKIDSVPIEIVHESRHSSIYRTRAGLMQIETELLQKLHEAGWTAISHLLHSTDSSGDSRNLSFLWNGTMLRVFIVPDREDPTSHVVTWVKSLTLFSLPIPPDCGLVEFNDFLDLQLVANTNLSLEEATEFYNREMPRQGWLPRESGGKITPELCWLPFLQEQRDITIELVKPPAGKTQIRAGRYSDASWQLALQVEDAAEPESETESDDQGMQAADFPIFAAAKAPEYDNARNSIDFEIKPGTDLVELSEQYTAALKTLGWTTRHMIQATKTGFHVLIEKDDAVIYFTADIDPLGILNASIQSQAFKWTKELPIAAQLISYEGWLRRKRHPASLDLLDQYRSEMKAIATGN